MDEAKRYGSNLECSHLFTMIINQNIIQWCSDRDSHNSKKFHAVLCDPPYELGFMGKSWDSTGIAFDPKTWRAIADQCYPGAYLLAFGGTRTFHRIAVAIEDAGFEIRDTVMWVYGSGFPKSHNLKDDWKGFGTALKPAWEPIIIARKPLEGTVAQNALKYGSGALNIDGSRVGEDTITVNRHSGYNSNSLVESTKGKWKGEQEQVTGRWPANLIHDGSDEVVGMFPNTKAGVTVRHNSGGKNIHSETTKPPMDDMCYDDSGSAARFFYSAKVSKRERDAGLSGEPVQYSHDGREKPIENAYQRNDSVARNNHPTLKPLALTKYLATLILPPKLDKPRRLFVPFAGAGSEVIGAIQAGWDEVVGVEQSKEYCEIAEARVRHWVG